MLKLQKLSLNVSLLSVLGAASLFACQGGGGSTDGSGDGDEGGQGGDAGAGGGGSSGDDDSSGGSSGGDGGGSNATGGKGGANASGGSAGQTAMGGSGGSSGNTAGQGGMCTALSTIKDKEDPEIPPNLTFCEPHCIYRPNWPGHHVCGPAGSVYKPVAMKTTGFCGEKYNQDGEFPVSQAKIEPAAYNQAINNANMVNNPVAGVARAYLPGGQAAYDQAAAGQVAVTIWTSIMEGFQSTFKIENIHEYLVQRKEIPYTIAIFMKDDLHGPDRIKQLKEIVFPALKARWSKISDDPNYRSIAGQSTAGANAFDTIWMGTDVVAKGIGGSPSFACFTCMAKGGLCSGTCEDKNQAYMREIAFCPARPIRWTGTVGTCDIYGSVGERLNPETGCKGNDLGGQIDSSGCGATWLTTNKETTAALKARGMPHQLFIIDKGEHSHNTWGGVALPQQLRWIFKDITCKQ